MPDSRNLTGNEIATLEEPTDEKANAGCGGCVVMMFSLFGGFGISFAIWGWAIFSTTSRALAVREWIDSNWELVLVVVVLMNLGNVAWQVAIRLRSAYVNKYPDDMDLGANEWFSHHLNQLRLGRNVELPLKSMFGAINTYDPRRNPVMLKWAVTDKKNPIAWTMAAHELGHVLVHRNHPGWSALNLISRSLLNYLVTVLPVWLLLSAFFATSLTVNIVFGALIVATAVGAVVCIDDVWASRVAMREMRAEAKVSAPALDDIRRLLVAVFATHGAPVAAFATTLLFWTPLKTLLPSGGYELADPLAGTARIATMGLGAALIALSMLNLSRQTMIVEPATWGFKVVREATAIFLTFAFVFLTWNSNGTSFFVVAIFLAASSLSRVLSLLMLPLNSLRIPSEVFLLFVKRFGEKLVLKTNPTRLPNEAKDQRFYDPDSYVTRYTFSVWSDLAVVPVVVLWFLSGI
jgi:Zn-dependent membrane protease YugP